MRSERYRGLIPGLGVGLTLGLTLGAGCKPEPYRPDAAPPWWKPAPGVTADWDIQLGAPFDVSATRAMYTIDLWAAVPADTTLDYGDGAPVVVPKGAHASAIADLHGRAQPAVVICHVDTGAIRLTDPDAMKFPGYAASPPNRPAPLAAGSVIGWSITNSDASERWLDLHDVSRAKVMPLVGKRLELAQAIGCDGIAAYRNDQLAYQGTELSHGFSDLTPGEYASWSSELTGRAHDLRLSIGLRSTANQAIDVNSAVIYDWLMTDRCGEYNDCGVAQPFLNAHKATFAIEYRDAEDNTSNDVSIVCGRLTRDRVEDALFKDAALTSAFYMRCP